VTNKKKQNTNNNNNNKKDLQKSQVLHGALEFSRWWSATLKAC
jgi:hypothetical protein